MWLLVGSKRKKMTESQKSNEKKLKKAAKIDGQKNNSSGSAPAMKCKSCQEQDPSTARSKLCRNHNVSKDEQVTSLLGKFSTTTQEFKNDLTATLVEVSYQVRSIMFRSQLFVNYYVI